MTLAGGHDPLSPRDRAHGTPPRSGDEPSRSVGDEAARLAGQAEPASPGKSPDRASRSPRPGLRELLHRSRTTLIVYRTVVAVLGVGVIGLGIVLLPLPGPGWLVIFVGLGILASEFAWAERLLHYARTRVRDWTRWVARQALGLRLAIGAAGLGLVTGIVVVSLRLTGVPEWVPEWLPLIR